MLAIGGPGKVLLWNWAGKEEPRSVIVPGYPRFGPQTVRIVWFSPDGKLIAAGTNRIVLADTETGKVVRSVTVSGAESWGLDSLAFSPDGKQLAVNAAGGVTLWDVANGNLARRLRHPARSASNLVFSPDGRRRAGNTFYFGASCVGISKLASQLAPTAQDISYRPIRCDFSTTINSWPPPATMAQFVLETGQLQPSTCDAPIRLDSRDGRLARRQVCRLVEPRRHSAAVGNHHGPRVTDFPATAVWAAPGRYISAQMANSSRRGATTCHRSMGCGHG